MWAPRTAALSLWEEVQLLPGFGLYLEGVGNGRALSPPRLKNMGRTILELAVAVVKRDAVRRPGVDHSNVSAPARARRVSKDCSELEGIACHLQRLLCVSSSMGGWGVS